MTNTYNYNTNDRSNNPDSGKVVFSKNKIDMVESKLIQQDVDQVMMEDPIYERRESQINASTVNIKGSGRVSTVSRELKYSHRGSEVDQPAQMSA